LIKDYNILGVKNWQTLAALWAGALSCNKNFWSAERSWTNPLNALQEAIHLLLYKILHLLFFPVVRILCALRLESQKNVSTWS
jgi:hypothetical protein